MSADTDALDRLVVTIVTVRRRFGARAYRAALSAARQAVAALVLREAEQRAGAEVYVASRGEVVQFARTVRRQHGKDREDED